MWKLFGLVRLRRTLTGYYLGVTVVLAILNTIAWFVNAPRLYEHTHARWSGCLRTKNRCRSPSYRAPERLAASPPTPSARRLAAADRNPVVGRVDD
jgi:hypothetical protein